MAPNCQGDDSIGQHVETLLHSRVDVEVTIACGTLGPFFDLATLTLHHAQVGMLVGRQGSRDSILLMLPTPQQVVA